MAERSSLSSQKALATLKMFDHPGKEIRLEDLQNGGIFLGENHEHVIDLLQAQAEAYRLRAQSANVWQSRLSVVRYPPLLGLLILIDLPEVTPVSVAVLAIAGIGPVAGILGHIAGIRAIHAQQQEETFLRYLEIQEKIRSTYEYMVRTSNENVAGSAKD